MEHIIVNLKHFSFLNFPWGFWKTPRFNTNKKIYIFMISSLELKCLNIAEIYINSWRFHNNLGPWCLNHVRKLFNLRNILYNYYSWWTSLLEKARFDPKGNEVMINVAKISKWCSDWFGKDGLTKQNNNNSYLRQLCDSLKSTVMINYKCQVWLITIAYSIIAPKIRPSWIEIANTNFQNFSVI